MAARPAPRMHCLHLRAAVLALCFWVLPGIKSKSPRTIRHLRHKFDLDHHHTQGVPHIIHQSWKTKDDIPERFSKWQASWKEMHPKWEYRLVNMNLSAALVLRLPSDTLSGSDWGSRAYASPGVPIARLSSCLTSQNATCCIEIYMLNDRWRNAGSGRTKTISNW